MSNLATVARDPSLPIDEDPAPEEIRQKHQRILYTAWQETIADPANGVAFMRLGDAKLAHPNYGAYAAMFDYDRAIALSPDVAAIYIARGVALLTIYKKERAARDFDQAIALEPENAFAHLYRGRALAKPKTFYQTKPFYDRAIALKPDFGLAYAARADLHLAVREYSEAVADYDQAIGLAPDAARLYERRARARNGLGQHKAAVRDAETSVGLDPGDFRAAQTLGDSYCLAGRQEEAVKAWALLRANNRYQQITQHLMLRDAGLSGDSDQTTFGEDQARAMLTYAERHCPG